MANNKPQVASALRSVQSRPQVAHNRPQVAHNKPQVASFLRIGTQAAGGMWAKRNEPQVAQKTLHNKLETARGQSQGTRAKITECT